MSPKSRGGIAARAGRWSARHRKAAVLVWLVAVIGAFVLGGPMGTGTKTVEQKGTGDSARAEKLQKDAFPESTTGQGEMVFVQSKTLTADAPRYRAVVHDLEQRLDALPDAQKVQSPYARGAGNGLISPDRHAVQIAFEVPGTLAKAQTRVHTSLAVTRAVQKANPDFYVSQFGSASSEK
jgi:uncharacterized membrane protein YdfJ with MMPL/SSD domain